MTAPNWPGLGFDPAPGEPAGAGGLGQRLMDTATKLRQTHEALARTNITGANWEGEAAAAFSTKIAGLPRYLDDAHRSLQQAGGVLREWQGQLTGLQARGRELETQAQAVRRQLGDADTAARQARTNPDFGLQSQQFTPADLPAAEQRISAAHAQLDQAIGRVNALRESLNVLLQQGELLFDEHETQAGDVAKRIRAADDGLAPPEPGWFEKVGEWLSDPGNIADLAGLISSVAGALALIPALTPVCGTIALVASGVAVLARSADMVVDKKGGEFGDYVDIGGDLAGFLPGFKILKVAAGEAKVAYEASETARDIATRAWTAGRAKAISEVNGSADAGPIATWVGEKITPGLNTFLPSTVGLTADPIVVGKSVEALTAAGSQVPTVAGWIPGEDNEVASNVVGTSAGVKDLVDWKWGNLQEAAAAAVDDVAAAAT